MVSRWRSYARRILDWKHSKEQDGKRVHESSPVPAEAAADALRDKLHSRKTSVEVKHVTDVSQGFVQDFYFFKEGRYANCEHLQLSHEICISN